MKNWLRKMEENRVEGVLATNRDAGSRNLGSQPPPFKWTGEVLRKTRAADGGLSYGVLAGQLLSCRLWTFPPEPPSYAGIVILEEQQLAINRTRRGDAATENQDFDPIVHLMREEHSFIYRNSPEEKRLVGLHPPTMVSTEQRVVDDHNSITSMKVGFSDLEQLLRQRRFTRVEAKQLMEIIDSRTLEPDKLESENNSHVKGSFIQGDTTSFYDEWRRAKILELSIATKSIMGLSTSPMVPGVTNIAARPSGSSFQDNKTSPYCGSYRAKKVDQPIPKKSITSLFTVPVISGRVTKIAARPRGRSPIYRMAGARSPFFNIDPSAKEKMWRDVSFVNDGNGLQGHISSTNPTISSPITLHSPKKPYFHISAPEVPSDFDEEDDETDIFVYPSLGKPKGKAVVSSTHTINSSHATLPS